MVQYTSMGIMLDPKRGSGNVLMSVYDTPSMGREDLVRGYLLNPIRLV
jgi:hypothetical protein